MIDINQPVKQGHDVVLNVNSAEGEFEQRLGTAEEFNQLAAEGKIVGVHTEPHRDVLASLQVEPTEDAEPAPTEETSNANGFPQRDKRK